MSRPVAGFTQWPPVKTPVFRVSVFRRETKSMAVAAARYASTSARRSALVRASTSGCSGAKTMNVAPKTVSGRVVKTAMDWRSADVAPGAGPASAAGGGREGEVDVGALAPADP